MEKPLPVLISQAIRGYEGTISGVLVSDVISGLSAREQKNRLNEFKNNPGMPLKLIFIDDAITVIIRNVTYVPIARHDGSTDYEASFDFFQTDF